jgi:UDP-3-O-[3-hydroxymyristoyl] N-acetylglucosamine deacetylase
MYTQKTIKKPVSCSGIGVHSGSHVQMTFKPAGVDTGIVFKRTDLADHPIIKAAYQNIVDMTYATTLGKEGVTIQTVEHVLSAVNALGIKNLIIEVSGSEVPVIDGSASCFVNMLLDAGIETQCGSVRVIHIKQELEVRGKESIISVEPYDGFKITYTIDFPNPFIGVQTKTYEISPWVYINEIAHARTFCLYEEVEHLWKMGLSKGGSLDNAVVFAQDRILNGSLRYKDEPVRHKMLDLLGDIIFLGHPLLGHIKAYKAGHALHAKFVKAVLSQPEHWTYLTDQDIAVWTSDMENDHSDLFHVDETGAYQRPRVFA